MESEEILGDVDIHDAAMGLKRAVGTAKGWRSGFAPDKFSEPWIGFWLGADGRVDPSTVGPESPRCSPRLYRQPSRTTGPPAEIKGWAGCDLSRRCPFDRNQRS